MISKYFPLPESIITDTFSQYPVNDNNGVSHSLCNKLTFDYLHVYPTEEDQFNAFYYYFYF